ncbi:hypothetical protein MTR67_043041 [Solanum verrucosum]|uniref:mRNA cap-binding protein n=1 Tax=Solanum verrucosum TaxID=315347 RepID=A0AAF0UQK7_SOLVR|nr:hypothetical protein MTR67_043041 [Solanum verrucosum]
MQVSSTQENEESGTITFDVLFEETYESLEVDSEQYSVHKTEELDKNARQWQCPGSCCFRYIAEEGSKEVALGHNNNRSEEETMEVSEINHAEAKKEKDFQNKNRNLGDDMTRNSDGNVTKKPHEQDEPHCGDTSDFVAENGDEEDNFNQMFECQVDEAAECNSDVARKQELMEEPTLEKKNPWKNMKFIILHCVNNAAHGLEVAGENPMEEYEVDHTEANVDAPAAAMEVIGQEESIEESEVDYAEATMESEAHSLQPLFLSYLMLPRIVSVRLRKQSVIDHDEANVDGVAHALRPLVYLIPNAAPYIFFTGELNTMQNPSALARRSQNFVFWYTHVGVRTQTSYEDNIKKIVDFSTVKSIYLWSLALREFDSLFNLLCVHHPEVEGFWVCYCHLARPSALLSPTYLHLFKEGIRPLWKDAVNSHGGKWIIRFKKAVSGHYWEDLVS